MRWNVNQLLYNNQLEREGQNPMHCILMKSSTSKHSNRSNIYLAVVNQNNNMFTVVGDSCPKYILSQKSSTEIFSWVSGNINFLRTFIHNIQCKYLVDRRLHVCVKVYACVFLKRRHNLGLGLLVLFSIDFWPLYQGSLLTEIHVLNNYFYAIILMYDRNIRCILSAPIKSERGFRLVHNYEKGIRTTY